VHAFTHGLISWVVAESVPGLDRRDRALVLAGGLIPDLDALTIIGGSACYQEWHRLICHNVLFAGLCVVAAGIFSKKVTTALLVLVTIHLHFLCDVLGSAGPDGSIWPVPYWLPFLRGEEHYIRWSGQWQLASWPNYAITAGALVACAFLGLTKKRTFVETFSKRADAAVVEVLERRLGRVSPLLRGEPSPTAPAPPPPAPPPRPPDEPPT